MSIPGPHNITRRELTNGITILVMENPASPTAVVSGYLAVGSADETDEQAGLAAFTADGLSRGTVNRTYDQLYAAAESVGASFGISAGTHTTSFGAKSLAEDLPLMLDLLADALCRPTFPPDEIEKLRGEILTDLEERAHDTGRMAALTFRELAYPPGHPYHRSHTGTLETVSALTRDDLLCFHQRHYGPRGMVAVIVGDVETERVLAQFEATFGDWAGPVHERPSLPPVARLSEARQKRVPIAGKTQADIVLGYPGPARAEPDFLDAMLCNTILGIFGMMGRLGKNVREEQGLAYYCYSLVEGGVGPGPWKVIAGVDPANVEQAVESIRSEIRRIRAEPVEPGELDDSQAFLVGSLPLRLETNEGLAASILNMEQHGLGLDYMQRYEGLIGGITVERVQAAARRWLDPDAYALAIAGPP